MNKLQVTFPRVFYRLSGERQKVLNWLLSYNPLWLRIGLEVFLYTLFLLLICLNNVASVLTDDAPFSDDLRGADLAGKQRRCLRPGYVRPPAAAVEPRHRR